MTCVKCGRLIADDRVRVAIMLGDGRAALDWRCFESTLKLGRAAELMRLLRGVTKRSRANGATTAPARGEKYQDEHE
jgi:hypothetical protein